MGKFNIKRIAKHAEEAVLRVAASNLVGLKKREAAAKEIIEMIDGLYEPEDRVKEAISDVAITLMAHAMVELAYQLVKASGALEKAERGEG